MVGLPDDSKLCRAGLRDTRPADRLSPAPAEEFSGAACASRSRRRWRRWWCWSEVAGDGLGSGRPNASGKPASKVISTSTPAGHLPVTWVPAGVLVEMTFDAGFPDAFGRPLPTAVTGNFMTSTTGAATDAGCD